MKLFCKGKFILRSHSTSYCLIAVVTKSGMIVDGCSMPGYIVDTRICHAWNHIDNVIVSVLLLCAVDHRYNPWLSQTKAYEIGICCFSAKYAASGSKNKDCLTQNQDNVSEWSNLSTHNLLFKWTSTMNIQLSVLV